MINNIKILREGAPIWLRILKCAHSVSLDVDHLMNIISMKSYVKFPLKKHLKL